MNITIGARLFLPAGAGLHVAVVSSDLTNEFVDDLLIKITIPKVVW